MTSINDSIDRHMDAAFAIGERKGRWSAYTNCAFGLWLMLCAGALACITTPGGTRLHPKAAAFAAPIASTAAEALCAQYGIPGCGAAANGALAFLAVEDEGGELRPILCLDVTDEDPENIGTQNPDGFWDWSKNGTLEHGGRRYLCDVVEAEG